MLTLREVKGIHLTWPEGDTNFAGLADGSLWNDAALAQKAVTFASIAIVGDATISGTMAADTVETDFVDAGTSALVLRGGSGGFHGKVAVQQNNQFGKISLQNNAGSNAFHILEATDVFFLTESSRGVSFATDGDTANVALRVKNTLGTPAINNILISGGPVGFAATLFAESTGADASIRYATKGAGQHLFAGGATASSHVVIDASFDTLGAAYHKLAGSAAGGAVTWTADGSDADIPVSLSGKGVSPVIVGSDLEMRGASAPQNVQSAHYTLVAADANKHLYHPASDNNPRTFTIPANSVVPYKVGTMITFVNDVNVVTIAINTDTLVQLESGSTGNRALAANGAATAIKVAATRWYISGAGLT